MTSLLGRLRLLKRQWDTNARTHTHAHLCAAWTQKSFASLKSFALSLACFTPARRQSNNKNNMKYGNGFFSFVFIFDVSSPHLNHFSFHPSRSVPIFTGLPLRLRTRPHIILDRPPPQGASLCGTVCVGFVTIWRISDWSVENQPGLINKVKKNPAMRMDYIMSVTFI